MAKIPVIAQFVEEHPDWTEGLTQNQVARGMRAMWDAKGGEDVPESRFNALIGHVPLTVVPPPAEPPPEEYPPYRGYEEAEEPAPAIPATAPEPQPSPAPEPSPDYNMARGAAGRAAQLTGDLFGFGEQVSQSAERTMSMGGFVWEPGNVLPSYYSAEKFQQWQEQGGRQPLDIASEYWRGEEYGYIPRHTWDAVKKKFSKGGAFSGSAYAEVLSYAAEQGIKSIPDMMAVTLAPFAYVPARSAEIGEERAKNKGKESADLTDMMEAAPAAIASAILERIGAKGITQAGAEIVGKDVLKAGAKAAAKHIARAGGKAATKEALTEFAQEGIIEYLGEKYGTGAALDIAEALDRGFAGAVAGGVYGGAAGTAVAGGQAAVQAADPQRAIGREMLDQEAGMVARPIDPLLDPGLAPDIRRIPVDPALQQREPIDPGQLPMQEHLATALRARGLDPKIVIPAWGLGGGVDAGTAIPEQEPVDLGVPVADQAIKEPAVPRETPVPAPETGIQPPSPVEPEAPESGRLTFEQFRQKYTDLFNRMISYTADEAGSTVLAREMAELSDKYPGWAGKVEEEAQTPADPIQRMADHLRTDKTGFKDIGAARTWWKDETGEDVSTGTPEAKAFDESVEQAGILAARRIVREGIDPDMVLPKLMELQGRMPNLSVRTADSIERQAYSTPLPLAYAAGRMAGIGPETTVYDSTAGHGALELLAEPENVTVNELDADRAAFLERQGFDVTSADATALEHEGKPVDVVIANPPFGPLKDPTGKTNIRWDVSGDGLYTTSQIDHAIAIKSLDAMADDGRAVLLVGSLNKLIKSDEARSDAYNQKAKREFFLWLKQHYGVTDIFTVSGDLYSQQGAGWPIDVIVIDGRHPGTRPVPAAQLPEILIGWDQVAERIKTHEQAPKTLRAKKPRPKPERPADDGGKGQGARADTGREQPRRPAGGGGRPSGSGGGVGPATVAGGDIGPGRGPVKPVVEPVQPDGTVPGVPERRGKEPAGAKPGEPVPGGGRAEPDRRAKPVKSTEKTLPVAKTKAKSKEIEKAEKQGSLQVPYTPASKSKSVDTLVPAGMSQAMGRALADIQSRKGSIDSYVANELQYEGDIREILSAEQVDAIALGIDNIAKGSGFIIGDQTGVGKGRVVAAMIRWSLINGHTPIFVTEKPDLFTDMYRDLTDVDIQGLLGREPNLLATHSGRTIVLDEKKRLSIKTAAAAKHDQLLTHQATRGLPDYDAVFTTYSQMQTVNAEETVRRGALQQLANGAMLILDESHNAGGQKAGEISKAIRVKAEREGKVIPPTRAEFVREMVKNAHGVLFSSATFAKRPDVMDLYASTDMRFAVENPEQIGDLIESGGVPMQQIVAEMLVDSGQYVRREKSFDGIKYDQPRVSVDEDQYDNLSSVMMSINAFSMMVVKAASGMNNAAKAQGRAISGSRNSGGAGVESTNFTSTMHNIIEQALMSMKAAPAADMAIESLGAGEKVVLGFSKTMETMLNDYAKDRAMSVGDEVNLSFGDLMTYYLEKSRVVRETKPFTKKEDQPKPRRLTDEELGDEGMQAWRNALDSIETFVSQISTEALPISPLDYIATQIRKAGYSTREITGRSKIIEYRDDGKAYLAFRPKDEKNIAGKQKTKDGFNTGQIDALLINQSGATGISLHASEFNPEAGQAPRHMIIVQADPNIDTHMQMLGRINRTGQVVLPRYSQMIADVPAENRPAAVLAKKMASLNANTTAGRKSSVSGDESLDVLNEYGDDTVWEMLEETEGLNDRLGNPAKGEDSLDVARKVTGRLMLLPLREQVAFYNELFERYQARIDAANAAGDNKLEALVLDLDAEVVESKVMYAKTGDSPFQGEVRMETLKVNLLTKSLSSVDILDAIPGEVDEKLGVEEQLKAKRELEENSYDALYAEAIADYIAVQRARFAKMKDEKAKTKATDEANTYGRTFISAAKMIQPGVTVDLTRPDGEVFHGVVLRVVRTKSKNPIAHSAWKAVFGVVGPQGTITETFGHLFPEGGAAQPAGGADRGFIVKKADTYMGEPMIRVFDNIEVSSRETREMITGNLLSAYKLTRGLGSIIKFTNREGGIRQGILMSRSYDPDKQESDAVSFISMEQAIGFVVTYGGSLKSLDGAISIKRNPEGGLIVDVMASKKRGGKYFMDRKVREELGTNQFTSVGGNMRVVIPPDLATRVLDLWKREGAGFMAASKKDAARKLITGETESNVTESLISTSAITDSKVVAEPAKPKTDPYKAIAHIRLPVDVTIRETGERKLDTESAGVLLREADDRISALRQLRGCLSS